eukprot:TRINITY_DN14264_c0_g1_i1.p1 TRINITY_DN14264_c0_g1~~TRINITY_DN14264_c0_g1_i1.p1  ORF type:complete len:407 (-),score=42.61 TRINITY_DN14264_c0_g1_i1:41-1210(-)
MSEQEYTKEFGCKIPRDESDPQYTVCFTKDQPDAILDFFREWGFVVLRDALTQEDCDATANDLHNILERGAPGWDRNDPATWDRWPENSIPQYGQAQRDPIFTPQFIRNRQNPNIYALYQLLLGGESDLLVNHDRSAFFRPTKMNPKWGSKANVHLDMNPWQWLAENSQGRSQLESLKYDRINHFIFENNQPSISDGLQLQAVINILDNTEQDGGYVCVPKFHKFFDRYWKPQKPNMANPSHGWQPRDWVFRQAQRVAMRPGSVVVWDQRMPHGSFPNNSYQPRLCQMIKIFPAKTVSFDRYARRAAAVQRHIQPLLAQGLQITDVGRIVFGTRAWTCLPPSAGPVAGLLAAAINGSDSDANEREKNDSTTTTTSAPRPKSKGKKSRLQ